MESTVGGVTSTSLTRSSDNINYYYTITYLPENITNGTVVTVSGSSIYAGVSKSFVFSFTGTKSTIITDMFVIKFTISNSYGSPINTSTGHSHGLIDIESSNMINLDSRTSLSLSSTNSLYGIYEVDYDSSDTSEYVATIIDAITIYVDTIYPSTFGSGYYVGFTLAFDGFNPIDTSSGMSKTIKIHSPKINGGTSSWESGTATITDVQPLMLSMDIDNISESSLSGQSWTDSVYESFDTVIGALLNTNYDKKIKLILNIDIQEG